MVKTASRVSKDHTFLTVASKFEPKAKNFFWRCPTMDKNFYLIAVIVYTVIFLIQFIINFVNCLRTGKISKFTLSSFNPPTQEETQEVLTESNGDYLKALTSLISYHES